MSTLSFFVLLSLSVCFALASREVTLTCGDDDRMREKGDQGVPGKQGAPGPLGPIGPQGMKGDKGECIDRANEISQLENKVDDLETQLQTYFVLLRKDCQDVVNQGFMESGLYNITVGGSTTEVYCEVDDSNGWLVFQRRIDGSTDFYRDWNEYVNGFGNKDHEFWLGLETLHRILSSRSFQLRIDIEDFAGNTGYALYTSFFVGDSSSNYRLTVAGFSDSNMIGDSLATQNSQQFSTRDMDHDAWSQNCAESYHGAWWYAGCHHSNLNGRYLAEEESTSVGITWYTWRTEYITLKHAMMKIRPV